MNEIEPLLITQTYSSPGPGLMSCIDCHGDPVNPAYSVYTLIAGQSRNNFTQTGEEIDLNNPALSLILRKPLQLAGGGTATHGTSGTNGGKPFANSANATYQTI